MTPATRRTAAGLLILTMAVTVTCITRQRLHLARRASGLETEAPAVEMGGDGDMDGDGGGTAAVKLDATTQIALYSVGLGVLRAFAINSLWLRTIYLQRRGEYFEAASLAEAITLLQPRLPKVWTLHAHNMAYNIAAAFPADSRFRWIERGLSLLEDDGLRFNPRSHSILQEISLIHFDKVGGSVHHLDLLHDQALARRMNVSGEALPATLQRWGIDPVRARRFQRQHRWPRLDFRSGFAHSAYWAARAIEVEREKGLDLQRSRNLRFESVRMLMHHGRIVPDRFRSRERKAFAMLPNLDYLSALEHLIAAKGSSGSSGNDSDDGIAGHLVALADAVFYLYAHGRREEAGAQLNRLARAGGVLTRELDDFVRRFAIAYLEDTAEPTAAQLENVMVALIECAQCTVLAEEVGERSFAFSRGLLELARLVHNAWRLTGSRSTTTSPDRPSRPAFGLCVAAVFSARRESYSEHRPELARAFTERFAQVYPALADPDSPLHGENGSPARTLRFPRPVALPWRLALLDPYWEERD